MRRINAIVAKCGAADKTCPVAPPSERRRRRSRRHGPADRGTAYENAALLEFPTATKAGNSVRTSRGPSRAAVEPRTAR